MTQAWIWACSPTSCGNLSIVVLLICVSLSRTVGAPDVSPAQDLLERLEHAALVHRLAQGGVDLLQLRFAVRHDARVANDLEHGDVSAAVANRHDVFQLHTERFDDAAQAAALVDAGAGDAYEGSAGQGWRRPGSDLRSVDRDRLGLLTLSGLDHPLCADHRLAARHLVQVAHECVDADEFGVLLQRRGAPLDVDVRGRVQLQRVVQFPRPCHQVEDVLLLQRGRVQGVAVGFCYDRAVLEDVAVAGTDPLCDAQRRPQAGPAGARTDPHARLVELLDALPYAIVHLAVGTYDRAVEVEHQQRDQCPLTCSPSCSSCSSVAAAGAPVSGSAPRWFLGKAITSRMLSVPARNITSRSRPQAMPPWGGAP